MMLDLGLRLLLAYLIGSVMGALLMGQLSGQGDIRKEGSGNAGGTNALRTRGLPFALAVVAIDLGKGVLATTLIALLPIPGVDPAPRLDAGWVKACCGLAAVIGHVFPLFYGFRGGKGAATLVGVYLGLAPVLFLPILIVWISFLTGTGFVGFSTILAAASAPVFAWWLQPGATPGVVIGFASALALLLVYTHRENLQRMLRGEEDRKRAIMLLHRLSNREVAPARRGQQPGD